MKLIEIPQEIKICGGAPCPVLVSDDTNLFLFFYANINRGEDFIACIRFDRYEHHRFGYPGEESQGAHPYSKLGLGYCSYHILQESDLIKELKSIDSNHPYFEGWKWHELNHYVFTFHDSMFECIARGFEFIEADIDLYHTLSSFMSKKRRLLLNEDAPKNRVVLLGRTHRPCRMLTQIYNKYIKIKLPLGPRNNLKK